MTPITIAVLSDLHVGDARCKDLYPPGYSPGKEVVDERYIDQFTDFVRQEGIRADYLIVPGDVSNGGRVEQVELADHSVISCADALLVNLGKVLFVPGNHDVEWAAFRDNDPTGHYASMRYTALRDRNTVFKRSMDAAAGEFLDDPHFGIWDFDDLFAVGYNSAWHDRPDGDDPNHGYISESQVQAIAAAIDDAAPGPDAVRLFLVHHHPIQHSDPTGLRDFSQMQNANRLLAVLSERRFDLIVHGHRHQPNLEAAYSRGGGDPLAILCSGSFSAKMFPTYGGQINNQFHLIEVSERSAETGRVRGEVRSWAFAHGTGWRPSAPHDGTRHIQPFGEYILPEALEEIVKKCVMEMVEASGVARWTGIVGKYPDLKHVPRDRQMLVLGRVGARLGFVVIEQESEVFLIPE